MGKVDKQLVQEFLRQLEHNPIIPAVYSEGEPLDYAMAGDHPAIFVLGGDAFNLVRRIEVVRHRPMICVNVDLVSGIAGDASGIQYLSEHVEGIISTNRFVIERGNSAGLFTVQRLFALDAGATERGVKLVKRARPQCVEILPALAYPHMVTRYSELLDRPVLAGGLVRTPEELASILQTGAAGVSTSHRRLWKGVLDRQIKI